MDSGEGPPHGLVLAGGFPWSDSPLDRLSARQLLPVAHQPLITYALRWLRGGGVHDVVVCLNRATRAARTTMMECGADTPGLSFREDAMPRGSAGCARDAALAGEGGTFFVVDGTAIPTHAPEAVLRTHRAARALATVVVHQTARGDAGDCLSSPTGVFVFERRALELVAETGFQDIKENLIPLLHRAGEPVALHVVAAMVPRVVSTATYVEANRWAVGALLRAASVPSGFRRAGEALVHESAFVDAGARLVGPTLIGPHSRVLARATLIGPAVLGTGCTVAADAVLSRSVLWNRCLVSAQAVVDGSVLADDAIVEEGAYCSGQILVPARRDAAVLRPLAGRVRSVVTGPLRPRTAEE